MNCAILLLSNCLVGLRNAARQQRADRCFRELCITQAVRTFFDETCSYSFLQDSVEAYHADCIKSKDELGVERSMVYRSLARDSSDKDKRFPRSAAYIELLDLGLLSLTTAVELEQFDLIEIEADHLHNVPYYAFNFNEKGDTYYKDTECSLYKKRLLTLDLPANCNPPNYHNLWSKLDRKASK